MSLIQADARHIPLVDGCVQCCLSSPPYFGLRDYGVSGQIGLERTPEAYVASLVEVFREVRRVLRDDGTVWLNLGDSYASSPPGNKTVGVSAKSGLHGVNGVSGRYRETLAGGHATKRNTIVAGLKPKDLIGIPWRVAFALQADGWYLRSDIIWSKPNPMPESVTDRPTKSHEYVFLLSKAQRYFFDADAVREPFSDAMLQQIAEGYDGNGLKDYTSAGVQNPSDTKRRIIENARKRLNEARSSYRPGSASSMNGGEHVAKSDAGLPLNPMGRNVRSVWTITTKPYLGEHFATMPERLAERCILAGSRPGDLVFDPFGGSGTTVRVARKFNRRGVMLDLNPAYLKLAEARISGVQTDLFEVPA